MPPGIPLGRRLTLVVGAATSLVWATPRHGTAQTPDSLARGVDHAFAAWMDPNGPGCAVGVGRNGSSVFEKGYGSANLETVPPTPISPASIFHVASVSKQFTAMAIMLLVRDGKLSVDDDIRKYLPEIPNYGTTITIRHLLTHTSGLRDQWELLALERGRFEEDRITEADVMDIIPRQKALNFAPGSEYVYSNTGFTLLGVIVRRVSGKSLRDFADERIFKPLGMSHTHFHDDYTMLVPGRTSAYERRPDGWHVGIPNFDVYGATSLFTTVGDLLIWEANFDHPKVGDAQLIARMQTPTPLTTGDTSNYGFGLVMGKYRGARLIEHNGADAGYRSYVGRFPDQGLAIAITCNASTANTTALARGVADVFLGSSLPPAPAAAAQQGAGASVPIDRLRERVGVYFQPKTLAVTELTLRDGHLVIGRQQGPTLVPLSESRFTIAGQNAELVFQPGERGGFQVHSADGGRPSSFERKEPVTVTRALLAAYTGDYASDELAGAVYHVTASDTTLALRTGTSAPMPAHAVFADTFVGGGYTIQFTRTNGQVTGFQVTNQRVRRVAFVKKR